MFIHKESLLTWDNIQDDPQIIISSQPVINNKVSKKHDIYIIDNFITDELNEQILLCAKNHVNINTEYNPEQRDGSRCLIMMQSLSEFLFKQVFQIQDLHKSECVIGCATNKNNYILNSINPCFRINTYSPPSIGFDYHIDSPYTPNNFTRSTHTLLIYMNDNESGTEFLIPSENNNFISGETVKENMFRNKYTKFIIKSKKNRCVIFPHHYIHRGLPTDDIKIILRSDIVYINEDDDILANNMYKQAKEFYNYATHNAMNKNLVTANVFYDRAVTSRIYSMADDVMFSVMEYLSMFDIISLSLTNKTNFVRKNIFMDRKLANEYRKYNIDNDNNVILPYKVDRNAISTDLYFHKNELTLSNIDKLVKMAAVYTLATYGNKEDSKICIINKDKTPVNINDLLLSVYYEMENIDNPHELYAINKKYTNKCINLEMNDMNNISSCDVYESTCIENSVDDCRKFSIHSQEHKKLEDAINSLLIIDRNQYENVKEPVIDKINTNKINDPDYIQLNTGGNYFNITISKNKISGEIDSQYGNSRHSKRVKININESLLSNHPMKIFLESEILRNELQNIDQITMSECIYYYNVENFSESSNNKTYQNQETILNKFYDKFNNFEITKQHNRYTNVKFDGCYDRHIYYKCLYQDMDGIMHANLEFRRVIIFNKKIGNGYKRNNIDNFDVFVYLEKDKCHDSDDIKICCMYGDSENL